MNPIVKEIQGSALLSLALLAPELRFWGLAVSLQWAGAMRSLPLFREEEGGSAAVCSQELTVPGKLPNLQMMDEPLTESRNLSHKGRGVLQGTASGDSSE